MSNTEKGKIVQGRRECEEAIVWKDRKEEGSAQLVKRIVEK